MINPTGYTALDLVGFTDKGTYASNVNYVKNDIVHYGGNLWRCKIDDTMNVTPAEGNNWTVFVGEPTNLVERIIAPLEENPATIAYAAGRQIIYDDWLWDVIDDIAVGDPLIDYAVDPTNANIKKAAPVETQLLDIKAKVGPLASLATTIKTSIVAAINEIVGKIGDLSLLGTTDKSSAVNAINELNTKVYKTEVLISNSGDVYRNDRAYSVDDYCIHDNTLQRCITPCSTGSWATNQSCFTADTLVNSMSDKVSVGRYALVNSTSPTDVPIGNNERSLLVCIGKDASRCALFYVHSSDAGVAVVPVNQGANITVTASTNNIRVASTSTLNSVIRKLLLT